MNEENTKEVIGLDALFEPFILTRLAALECGVKKTNRRQHNQTLRAKIFKLLTEAQPKNMQADLKRFAGLWEDSERHYYSYCYRRGFCDGVLFFSRILGVRIEELRKHMTQQEGGDSSPMRELMHSTRGLFSILDDEDFFTSTSGSENEADFWDSVKECTQQRVQLVGMEFVKDKKSKELDKESTALGLRLEDMLPKDKVELVEKYSDLIVCEELYEEDFYYCQGFADAARMLWGMGEEF